MKRYNMIKMPPTIALNVRLPRNNACNTLLCEISIPKQGKCTRGKDYTPPFALSCINSHELTSPRNFEFITLCRPSRPKPLLLWLDAEKYLPTATTRSAKRVSSRVM